MIRLSSLSFALAGLAMLGACATATPYQAATPNDRGFSEQQIENNRFRVDFSGNSLTDRRTVETYLLYRAAELTKATGHDHFSVVNRNTDANSRLVSTGAGYAAGWSPYYSHFYPHYRFYGARGGHWSPRHGYVGDPRFASRFGAFYDPFYGGGATSFREVVRYDASAEIVMGRGPKPNDPAYFDAAQVLNNLANQIIRPEPG